MKLRWIALFAAGMMFNCGNASTTNTVKTAQHESILPDEPLNGGPNHTSGAQSAQSSLSADELQRLNQQRRNAVGMLTAIEHILNTSSFASRAEAYCRLNLKQSEAFSMFGDVSEASLRDNYRQVMRSQPTTQEGELQRQQQLAEIERFMGIHIENRRQCQGMLVSGMQSMPSDQELREKVNQWRQQIAEIDQQIASGIQTPQQPVAQPAADGEPVVLHKVEAESSEEANLEKFNGDVHASIEINEQGDVSDIQIIDSPGLGLDEKVVAALRQWKFRPAVRNGITVPTRVTVSFSFRTL